MLARENQGPVNLMVLGLKQCMKKTVYENKDIYIIKLSHLSYCILLCSDTITPKYLQ